MFLFQFTHFGVSSSTFTNIYRRFGVNCSLLRSRSSNLASNMEKIKEIKNSQYVQRTQNISALQDTDAVAATFPHNTLHSSLPNWYILIHVLCEICFPSRAHERKGTLIGSYRDATEPAITSQGPAGDGCDIDVQLGNHGPFIQDSVAFLYKHKLYLFLTFSILFHLKPDGKLVCSYTENDTCCKKRSTHDTHLQL